MPKRARQAPRSRQPHGCSPIKRRLLRPQYPGPPPPEQVSIGLAAQLKLFDKLDQWLRRRLRMCYWKRWRHVRTRRRELIRLGVPRRQAIRHARSRKGPWHMAKSIAIGVGLTNAWLQAQELLSVKTLWAQLAPLRRTA